MNGYEEKLGKLNNELVEAANRQLKNEEIGQKCIMENMVMFGMYFQKSGIDFELESFRRSRAYNRGFDWKTAWEFRFYFNTVKGNRGDQIIFEVIFETTNGSLTMREVEIPRIHLHGDSMDLTAAADYHSKVSAFLMAINNTEELAKYCAAFIEPQYIEGRSKDEILREIEEVKEQQRRAGIDLRPGQKLYIATTWHLARGGYGWQLCTITKVNKKTVQYVVNWESGNTSEVRCVPLDYSAFQNIDEHAAWMEENKGKWYAK